jgi:hypothetical protein
MPKDCILFYFLNLVKITGMAIYRKGLNLLEISMNLLYNDYFST